MEKSLLLISSGSTFMVDALANAFRDVGLKVIMVEPHLKELEKYKNDPSVFFFYLGSYLEKNSEVLPYIKDICMENNKILCTVGDSYEYNLVTKIIPADIIMEHFDRPFNTRDVADKMLEIMSINEALTRQKSILLVDDDPTFLNLAKGWLDAEYKVSIVNSGMQAITYLATNKPDLILLDYEMPVTSGPKVMEMIKSETFTQDIPVIFLTGKGDKDSVMTAVALKPEGYLLKTMERDELLKAIRGFFEAEENS